MSLLSPSTGITTFRNVVMVLTGSGIFASSMYLTYQYQRMEQQYQLIQKQQQQQQQSDDTNKNNGGKDNNNCSCCSSSTTSILVNSVLRNKQYDTIATNYDTRINTDEVLTGITLLRRALLYWYAKGTVIEIGAGTGRNLSYYPIKNNQVHRVLLCDVSEPMLQQAKHKVQTLYKNNPTLQQRFAFLVHDITASTKSSSSSTNSKTNTTTTISKLPSNSFDTVIDTFGLCSYDDPVAALNEMARICKDDDGIILLLEHGRSQRYNFINKYLDTYVVNHATNWGCIWNRNIDSILQQSNINIDQYYTFHFGTTYYIVGRPKKVQQQQQNEK